MTTTITTLEDLGEADDGSYYTVAGAAGDLQEWVDGYHALLKESDITAPTQWFKTTGAAVNRYSGVDPQSTNAFPSDLTFLLFPLDGMEVGKLAMFKLRCQDRWFDDVIANMH